jgi:hypothetical protein
LNGSILFETERNVKSSEIEEKPEPAELYLHG